VLKKHVDVLRLLPLPISRDDSWKASIYFVRSKRTRAHCPLVISSVTKFTKKCNLTVLHWSSIYKSIIWKLDKMSSCQTRAMYSFIMKTSHLNNGRFGLKSTSVRLQTWPRLNFRETTYGVYQIFICTGGQYLINYMTCRGTRWILQMLEMF